MGAPRAGTIPRAYLTFHIILRTYPMYVAISHVPLGAPFVPEPVIPNVALGAPCFCQDRRQYCLRATHRTYTESYVTTEKAGCGSKQASVLHRGTLRTAARAPFHGRSSRPCYPFHRAQGKWKKWGITESYTHQLHKESFINPLPPPPKRERGKLRSRLGGGSVSIT